MRSTEDPFRRAQVEVRVLPSLGRGRPRDPGISLLGNRELFCQDIEVLGTKVTAENSSFTVAYGVIVVRSMTLESLPS